LNLHRIKSSDSAPGCQIILGTTYQNGKNIPITIEYPKWQQDIQKGHEINKPNGHKINIPTSSIERPSQICPNWDCLV
jgi:hypothetical protein